MVTFKLDPRLIESTGYAIKAENINLFLKQVEGITYAPLTGSSISGDVPAVIENVSDFIYIICLSASFPKVVPSI